MSERGHLLHLLAVQTRRSGTCMCYDVGRLTRARMANYLIVLACSSLLPEKLQKRPPLEAEQDRQLLKTTIPTLFHQRSKKTRRPQSPCLLLHIRQRASLHYEPSVCRVQSTSIQARLFQLPSRRVSSLRAYRRYRNSLNPPWSVMKWMS